jgi:SAM-dependent methyltransferase
MASPYQRLATPQGEALLQALSSTDEKHATAAAATARKLADAELAAAALATIFARKRALASGKFPRADAMLFTRLGYEQASSHAVARHRAERFADCARVADLCCGIGGDALALAACMAAGALVTAVDVDDDALACLEHNAAALGVADKIKALRRSALELDLSSTDAAFADPSRRNETGRQRSSAAYAPPLEALLRRARELPESRLCVKVAPGLRLRAEDVRRVAGAAVELEFVSERGVCKEAAIWCGSLARAHGAVRATVIDADGVHSLDGDGARAAETAPLDRFVGEPDPAVIRSGLIGEVGARLAAATLDSQVAYMTAKRPTPSPYVRWYEVVECLPFGVRRVRSFLRSAGIGRLVIKTRAFPLRPDAIAALLKTGCDGEATLLCTTIQGRKTAIVCQPVGSNFM